ncbi:hypothetical protein V5G24_20210 [Xanthobacter sp. VTT E-85241]|uniref:hypothetical protein n=1 Tax=Roseixanthobacter finlandensis TaxID=3119922 RepID=UPI00372918DA
MMGDIPLQGARRERSWADMDSMTPEWRACVHEYGYAIVHSAREAGVKSPRALHQLVREIWDGARSYVDKKKPAGTLDWILIQSGAGVSVSALSRILANENLLIAPKFPTRAMINASLNELSDHSVRCTKFEKHQRRLAAALRACDGHYARMNSGSRGGAS